MRSTKEQPQELCDSYRAEGLWTDRLLTDFLESAVERSPDKIAVIDERFDPLTYAGLAKEVSLVRLSAHLRDAAHGGRRAPKGGIRTARARDGRIHA